ncbi:YfcL family protein [Neptunicella sp. SCSIO 80796]|uniref:YfcL family protein n=1 Tax=Neptunicella plasticusilytica TaxID=3117012 RepID=UPI003A4DF54F
MPDNFQVFINAIQQRLDDAVDHGCDEQLFFSGYLNGHFSLVVSQALSEQEYDKQGLQQRMMDSLQRAFDDNELEPADQQKVTQYWDNIYLGVIDK